MGRKKKKQHEWLPKYVTECKGYWVYRPWVNGKFEKQVSIGPVGMLKSEFFKKFEAITNEGKSTYTLGWLLEKYHNSNEFSGLAASTQRDRDYYRLFLGEKYKTNYGFFTDIPLAEFNPQLIRQFADILSDRQTMCNNILRYLRLVFAWGGERYKQITKNPVQGIKPHKIEETAARYVEDDELQMLGKIASRSEVHYLEPMIEIMYLCCLRTKEVLNLKRKDITDTHVICHRTKGSLATRVRISPRLQVALDNARNEKARVHNWEYLFYDNEGTPITYNALYGAWRRAMKKHVKAGGKKFRMHDLKHKGVTDNTDKLAGGHKTEAMRAKYTHKPDDVEPTR